MIIAHSMGNPVTLYFLNNYVTQEWKDKFVRFYVSLNGVWGGSAKTISSYIFYEYTDSITDLKFYFKLGLMASGDNVDIFLVKPLKLRGYQR